MKRLLDPVTRFFATVTSNRVSLAGSALTTVAAFLFLLLFSIHLVSAHGGSPYMGILTFLILPALFVVGLALIPVGLAIARRRFRVAAMVAVVLLCANETTQLLKPLLVAPPHPVWWSPIGDGSWPSGHATASMTLALCTVVAAPPRRRPAVAAAMVAFALGVCYSFLELGWHYPSDVFGGFLVAATWTLLGIAGLSIYEARAAAAPGPDRSPPVGATVSVGAALAPMGALLGAVAVCIVLVLLARPQPVLDYARAHEWFVLGAAAIGVLGLVIGSGLTLMLRRS